MYALRADAMVDFAGQHKRATRLTNGIVVDLVGFGQSYAMQIPLPLCVLLVSLFVFVGAVFHEYKGHRISNLSKPQA